MGLGKTVQSIALLAHLAEVREQQDKGFLKALGNIQFTLLLLLTNESIQHGPPASFKECHVSYYIYLTE